MTVPASSRPFHLDRWIESVDPWAHLAVAPIPDGDDFTIADLVEAEWGDYQPQQMKHWTRAVLRGPRAESYADPVQWVRLSGGAPTLIWGYFATHGQDGPLMWADPVVSSGPVAISDDGRPLVLWGRLRWGPECAVVPPTFFGGIRIGGDVYAPVDTGDPDMKVSYESENKDTVATVPAMALATHASGSGIIRANAGVSGRAAVGLAVTGADPGTTERVQTSGVVTRADWSAVVGAPLLTPRAVYYLAATDGGLTAIAPTVAGQVVQQIGRAVSANTLALAIQEAVLL